MKPAQRHSPKKRDEGRKPHEEVLEVVLSSPSERSGLLAFIPRLTPVRCTSLLLVMSICVGEEKPNAAKRDFLANIRAPLYVIEIEFPFGAVFALPHVESTASRRSQDSR